jgi:hypothetical protein
LFALNQTKQHTSSQFFKQIETVTGLPALETEFYFLVIRSLLLELCGIVLMSFSAFLLSSLRSQETSHLPVAVSAEKPISESERKRVKTNKSVFATKLPDKTKPDSSWAAKYINALREKHHRDEPPVENIDSEQNELLTLVVDLYRTGKLNNLEIEGIISVLKKQLSKNIQPSTAEIIQRLAKKRLNID